MILHRTIWLTLWTFLHQISNFVWLACLNARYHLNFWDFRKIRRGTEVTKIPYAAIEPVSGRPARHKVAMLLNVLCCYRQPSQEWRVKGRMSKLELRNVKQTKNCPKTLHLQLKQPILLCDVLSILSHKSLSIAFGLVRQRENLLKSGERFPND